MVCVRRGFVYGWCKDSHDYCERQRWRTAGDSGYTNAITGRQVSFFLRNKAPKERVRCPTTSGTGLFFIFPPGSSKPTHSVEIDARTKKKLQAMNATLTAKVDEQARQIARMQAEFERRLKERRGRTAALSSLIRGRT